MTASVGRTEAPRVAKLGERVTDLEQQRVTFVEATVVAVSPVDSTFTAEFPDGQRLAGVGAPAHFMPAVGDKVLLERSGALPIYQPGRVAENAIGDTELAPGVTDAIAASQARSETAIGQAEAANAAASQAADAALAADEAALNADAAATLAAQRADAARLDAEAAEASSGTATGAVLAAQNAADAANTAAQNALAQATASGTSVTAAQQAAAAAQTAADTAQQQANTAGTAAAQADAKAAQAAADAAKAAADALTAKQDAAAARQAATDSATSAGQATTIAQTAANGKNTILYSLNVPPTTGNTGRVAGDTWFRRDANGTIIGHWEWVVPASGTASWVSRLLASQA
ncbi:MAG: hypothetical protein DI543_28195, partial [Bradyrhizobium icense]